jgi:BMFP domain-containing protein YqiC
MATDTEDPEASARATLALLETRLHRLEYLLTGTSHHDNGLEPNRQPLQSKDTARAKLDALEAELGKLKNLSGSAGAVIRDVDQLGKRRPLGPKNTQGLR